MSGNLSVQDGGKQQISELNPPAVVFGLRVWRAGLQAKMGELLIL